MRFRQQNCFGIFYRSPMTATSTKRRQHSWALPVGKICHFLLFSFLAGFLGALFVVAHLAAQSINGSKLIGFSCWQSRCWLQQEYLSAIRTNHTTNYRSIQEELKCQLGVWVVGERDGVSHYSRVNCSQTNDCAQSTTTMASGRRMDERSKQNQAQNHMWEGKKGTLSIPSLFFL